MNPLNTNPPRNPARLMLPVFAAAAMVAAIWAALYFDLPSGVIITMISFTAGFLGMLFYIDACERVEREELRHD